ncbi:MAG: SulP family inorganic anion transporter [Rhodothermales bacterium]
MDAVKPFFPPAQWGPQYTRKTLRGDLVAGVTVSVILIPQGMAYALIAGLPPVYGLYAALVPLVVYALFGSSRQLAVGPVAIVSLLVAAGVAPLAGGDMERYIALAMLLTLMVGALQVVMGVARFGFLVHFLSQPVLTGFTSAAALIIGMSQLTHLLGVPIPRSHYVHDILWHAAQQLGTVHGPTLLIGLGGIGVLVALRRWARALPGPLVVVMLGTVIVWASGVYEEGVRIVGDVPGGLPAPFVPPVSLDDVKALLPIAVTIALVGYMQSIAVAKAFASRGRYDVDANQELIGLGIASFVGAFFRAYAVTGSFSRTAVNAEAGAETPVASFVSAGVIALTLLLLTPLFYYMPQAVLAAIIMVAVAGFIDLKEARFLWRVRRSDFFLMLLTFGATLMLGIEEGILVGVVASLILVIQRSSRPHTAVMGRLPGTTVYRNIERYPEARTGTGVVVLRVDAALYFANAAFLKEKLREIEHRYPSMHTLVFDAYPVNRIDATAAHALKDIVDDLRRKGKDIYFAGVKGPVRDVMEKAKMVEHVGPDHFFMEVHTAVEHAEASSTASATATASPPVYQK